MGLDAELCRKAKDVYRWEIQFAGEFVEEKGSMLAEVRTWIPERAVPSIGISSLPLENRPSFGFVDRDRADVLIYQPFATVYAGRERDYQEDLVRAALLHLRTAIPDKPAQIHFPSSLGSFVRSYHLWLLQPDNPEVNQFLGGIVPLYREGNIAGISEVLDSLRIDDLPRE